MNYPTLNITVLGSGTSFGVPVLGCQCQVCTSSDPRDNRRRASIIVQSRKTRILVDAGPDLRNQLMPLPFAPIHALLVTHIHYDHVGGIDDLRPFSLEHPISVYANKDTACQLRANLPYCFPEHFYPGAPRLELHTVTPLQPFTIGDIEITPIEVMHGKLPILGYRFGKFAYITDMKTISSDNKKALIGVDTLIVNALRFDRPHTTHQLVGDAIEFAKEVGAQHTFFTHLTHDIGLHPQADSRLPQGFHFAYDNMELTV